MLAQKEALEKLTSWYADTCDGDWEHRFGVEIQSLDNPGWAVRIDLKGTPLEGTRLPKEERDAAPDDWYRVAIEDGQFRGYGDPGKLSLLLAKFGAFADAHASEV